MPPIQVFHVEMGDPDAPVLLLIHGWPTSSIDWFEVADQLSTRFRVCAMDFPGYGFSDKPQGWGYSLARDAELVEFYLSQVIGAESAVVVADDRGDSVALIHAARSAEDGSAVNPKHLVLSNGNIFLPMSNLTEVQRRILDPSTSSPTRTTTSSATGPTPSWVLLHALEPSDDQPPGPLQPGPAAPLFVDASRERLPSAADLLHAFV